MTNILELKIPNKRKVQDILDILINFEQVILSVKYLSEPLDKCSAALFELNVRKFIDIYFLETIKDLKNKLVNSEEGYLAFFNRVIENDVNSLNYFEYIKNIVNYLHKYNKKEWNSIAEFKTYKADFLLSIESQLDKIIYDLGLNWIIITHKNHDYFILGNKNLGTLLELNNIKSDDISKIEWKEVILEFLKKTTIKESDHMKMLKLVQTTAEKYRNQITYENEVVAKELFKNLNSLCIRHDNSWNDIKKLYNISNKDEYLKLIKRTFQLFLLAMIIIDK